MVWGWGSRGPCLERHVLEVAQQLCALHAARPRHLQDVVVVRVVQTHLQEGKSAGHQRNAQALSASSRRQGVMPNSSCSTVRAAGRGIAHKGETTGARLAVEGGVGVAEAHELQQRAHDGLLDRRLRLLQAVNVPVEQRPVLPNTAASIARAQRQCCGK